MNDLDLDLCLEVVSRSCQPLRNIRRWISGKLLEIEARFQRTTNRKWHMDFQMVTWPMTSRDPKVLWGSTVGYPSDSLASCQRSPLNEQEWLERTWLQQTLSFTCQTSVILLRSCWPWNDLPISECKYSWFANSLALVQELWINKEKILGFGAAGANITWAAQWAHPRCRTTRPSIGGLLTKSVKYTYSLVQLFWW